MKQLFDHCSSKPDDPIINLGGGASALVDFLLREGFSRVAVLDISGIALAESRQRPGRGPGPVNMVFSR